MKSNKFQEMIGNIDDDLIVAADARAIPKKRGFRWVAAAAACLAFTCAITGTLLFRNHAFSPADESAGDRSKAEVIEHSGESQPEVIEQSQSEVIEYSGGGNTSYGSTVSVETGEISDESGEISEPGELAMNPDFVPEMPEERATELELVFERDWTWETMFCVSIDPEPDKDDVYGIGTHGHFLTDENGVFYYLGLASNSYLYDITHDRKLFRLDDCFDGPGVSLIYEAGFYQNQIYIMLHKNYLIVYDLETGEARQIDTFRKFYEEQGIQIYSLYFFQGVPYWEGFRVMSEEEHFFTLDGKMLENPGFPEFKKFETYTAAKLNDKELHLPINVFGGGCWRKCDGSFMTLKNFQNTGDKEHLGGFLYYFFDEDGNIVHRLCDYMTIHYGSFVPCDFLDECGIHKLWDVSATIGTTEFPHMIGYQLFWGADGTGYVLLAYQDRFQIYQVTMGVDPVPEFLAVRSESKVNSLNSTTTASDVLHIHYPKDSATSESVQSRITTMQNISWNFTQTHYSNACAANTRNGVLVRDPFNTSAVGALSSQSNNEGDPITLPRYLKQNGVINYGPQTGIPYCSGGINGLGGNSFLSNINASNAIPGNIKHRGALYSGSVGLDCCGFVSSAWGLSHQSLDTLYSFASSSPNSNVSDIISAQPLDLIFFFNNENANKHVAFFSRKDGSTIYVFDCQAGRLRSDNTWVEEKTMERALVPSEIQQRKEIYRISASLYNTHNFGQSWVTTTTQHWHTCSVCGAAGTKSSHIFGTAWSTTVTQHWHTCSVCGVAGTKSSHTFSSAWEKNAAQHWHKCTVCQAAGRAANHAYLSGSNKCKTCGYIREELPGSIVLPEEDTEESVS